MSTERMIPKAGEVWVADLGIVAKTRPVLILAYPESTDARMLVIAAPLTSQIRNLSGEIDIGKPNWLTKHSAVNVQALASISKTVLIKKLGTLSEKNYSAVKDELKRRLNLN